MSPDTMRVWIGVRMSVFNKKLLDSDKNLRKLISKCFYFLLTIILALNMSEQNCGFFVNDNSYQFYKNCSAFSHSKDTVMQCIFLESKNIGIFRDINFLMPDYELLQIKRVKLLKFFVAKTLSF